MQSLVFSSFTCNKGLLTPQIGPFSRTFASKSPSKSSDPAETTEPDKPVDFLQSPAASWKAQYSSAGIENNAPWQEMWSILFSVGVFMIYFCVLREENDIDDKISQPLYDKVPGLEEQNLLVVHKYNSENRQDNKLIEARMRELGMDVDGIRKKYYQ